MLKKTALIAALTALIGFQNTGLAAQEQGLLWSIVAHFQYQNGFEYDYVVQRGVTTSEVPAALAYCGSGHHFRNGAVVHFHCYPVPE